MKPQLVIFTNIHIIQSYTYIILSTYKLRIVE